MLALRLTQAKKDKGRLLWPCVSGTITQNKNSTSTSATVWVGNSHVRLGGSAAEESSLTVNKDPTLGKQSSAPVPTEKLSSLGGSFSHSRTKQNIIGDPLSNPFEDGWFKHQTNFQHILEIGCNLVWMSSNLDAQSTNLTLYILLPLSFRLPGAPRALPHSTCIRLLALP